MAEITPIQVLSSALPSAPVANENFVAFIEQGKRIAAEAGFRWTMQLDVHGVAIKGDVWDLRRLANDGRPTPLVLRNFATCEDAIQAMEARGVALTGARADTVSVAWQDLIKAYAIEHIMVRRKGANYLSTASNALRFVANGVSKGTLANDRRGSSLGLPNL